EALSGMMVDAKFGAAGSRVVIEEFLTGPEVSVLAFTDGECIKPMVSSMDHKRALDGDKGLNTGGMGTVAPNPYYTESVAEECMERVFLPTVAAMNAEGRTFKGCLYFGLMLTKEGPKVIEYNCRFGDPETQVVLPLLEGDLARIMLAVRNGTLAEEKVAFSDKHAACVIIASGGYPKAYKKGCPITVGDVGDAVVYHAGTKLTENGLVTSGGRVLGVTAVGETLRQALDKAYAAADNISFENMYKRSDIGARALKAAE
ncbi:MAG: phosphoribosylamine--glycine ligase, partial [Clostridia bacterium]|nr:phosphoribosylamine--glycine ligase [Clostridia bacterium]